MDKFVVRKGDGKGRKRPRQKEATSTKPRKKLAARQGRIEDCRKVVARSHVAKLKERVDEDLRDLKRLSVFREKGSENEVAGFSRAEERLCEALLDLGDLFIGLELLRETRIGQSVNNVVKFGIESQFLSRNVVEQANFLVAKWKSIAKEALKNSNLKVIEVKV